MAQYKIRKPLKTATFMPAKYGLDPGPVRVDPALGDSVLEAALTGALAEIGTDWNQRGLYVNVLGTAAASGSQWLTSWRAAEPSSPDAAAVYAHSLAVKAWKVRGGAYASSTSSTQFKGFHEILRTCSEEALKAAEMAPEDPTPWTTMIMTARGLQWPNEQFERIWQELLIRDPMNLRAHIQALQYWQPKWFGSRELADQFVADTATRAPHSALTFQLRLSNQMEVWLPKARRVVQPVYFRRGVGRKALLAALDDYWTEGGAVTRGGGLALLDNNWLAWALTLANRWDDACKAWLAIGGRRSESAQWLYVPKADYLFYGIRREAFVMSSLKPNQSKQPHQPTS
jgi:hypothetical protein